jgi:tetratricopeptide (TPR) repeat protein
MNKKKVIKAATVKPTFTTPRHLSQWPFLLLLALAVMAIYLPTSWYEFVNIDDADLIHNNPTVIDPSLSYTACFEQFLFTPYYKPLVFLSWRLEYQLLGPGTGHFHLFNWILHLCNTLLLFVVGIKMFRRFLPEQRQYITAAFFLALIFSVNPLRVESVSWATERKDMLFAFFLLLSWFCYLRYLESARYYFMLLGALCYLCSAASKSMGIPFVAILFLLDLQYGIQWSWRSLWSKWPYYLSFLVLLAVFGFFNSFLHQPQAVSAAASPEQLMVAAVNQITSLPYVTALPSWLQVLVTTSARVVLWILHCVFPVYLSIIYSHNKVYGYIGQGIFLYPLILIALFIWGWRKRKTSPYLLGGMLFYLISLSPVLAIPESGQAIFMSNRYTYIPSIGLFFIALAFLFSRKMSLFSRNAILSIVAAVYFIGSLQAVSHWKNSETLFSQALRVYPESGLAHLNLGLYYRVNKEYDRALEVYSEGIQYSKGYLQLYTNRSRIYLDRGQADLALSDLNYCLEKSPNLTNALINRGVAYAMKKEWDKSLADFNKADKLEPNTPDLLSNRALVYFSVNRFPEAINDLTKYIEMKPDDADNINILGLAYLNSNRYEEALKAINRSIELKPQEAAFYFNRSLIYRSRKDKQAELADLLKAKELGHPVEQAYINQLKAR